jgi:hypothetical protein
LDARLLCDASLPSADTGMYSHDGLLSRTQLLHFGRSPEHRIFL